MRGLEDSLSLALGVSDRAFWYSALRASLDRQLHLAEVEGQQLLAPTPEMVAEALLDAQRAVFQDPNNASAALSKIRKGLNKATGTEEYGVGSINIPFSQVPGSIFMRGIEFSPLGFINSLYQGAYLPLRYGEFKQKAFVDSFSRALVGTTALAGVGFWLYTLGILTALADEDKDLAAMQEASGFGKFRINVSALYRAMLSGNWWTPQKPQDGDMTVNYDWAQPIAMTVAMGGETAKRIAERAKARAFGLEAPSVLGRRLGDRSRPARRPRRAAHAPGHPAPGQPQRGPGQESLHRRRGIRARRALDVHSDSDQAGESGHG